MKYELTNETISEERYRRKFWSQGTLAVDFLLLPGDAAERIRGYIDAALEYGYAELATSRPAPEPSENFTGADSEV